MILFYHCVVSSIYLLLFNFWCIIKDLSILIDILLNYDMGIIILLFLYCWLIAVFSFHFRIYPIQVQIKKYKYTNNIIHLVNWLKLLVLMQHTSWYQNLLRLLKFKRLYWEGYTIPPYILGNAKWDKFNKLGWSKDLWDELIPRDSNDSLLAYINSSHR